MTADQSNTDSAAGGGRVDELVNRLTPEEKIDLVHGDVDPTGIATGYIPPNDRLDIPSFSLVDGPLGVRAGDGSPSTAFPASIALASSWDPDLASEMGETMAAEARAKDQDVLLAPGFNLLRVPQCGRSFEYYSEDPYLNSRIAVGSVEGIQAGGVAACAKHYAVNNQESDRMEMSSNLDERPLRELYLPAFEAVVKEAAVGSIMAAYNRINGTHATEHRRLLTDILKDEWGFEGFVVSDWWATTDGVAAARAGLDLDMPGTTFPEMAPELNVLYRTIDTFSAFDWFSASDVTRLILSVVGREPGEPHVDRAEKFDDDLRTAIEDGRLDESILDEKVRRILGQMERFGVLDDDQPDGEIDVPAHHEQSRRVAERGAVLLQNDDGTVPLDLDEIEEIAVVGPHGDEPKVGGGGSSEVEPSSQVSPVDGIKYRTGDDAVVTFEPGVDPVAETRGDHRDVTIWNLSAETVVDATLRDDEDDREHVEMERAVQGAEDADVAIVIVQDDATENYDRPLSLPGDQDDLVSAVAAVADETVVVLRTAGPVEMPWIDDVEAVLETWYPGQEDGRALARVLFGDVDAAGRLPVTFGKQAGDYPANTRRQHPGVDLDAEYSEGVFVGYRHFEESETEPLFPFGHGLSYTDFEYSDVSIDLGSGPTATVEVTVENVGDREGRDVVQVYLGQDDPSVERPPKELAAFESIALDAGESTTVELEVEHRSFAYYDEDEADWVVDDGDYTIYVGRSARTIVATETVTVE